MNHFGPHFPAAAARWKHARPYAAASAAPGLTPITHPTLRDVLNGRGQGVQRHPGNVNYRKLVFVNKGLYAKCPRTDKIKISKGIVAAVHELGGRFLELNERTGIYHDIGYKKATEKTSQALREGQTKIRKQMYKDEAFGAINGRPAYDTSVLDRSVPRREISGEGYFGYSVQVLQSLYDNDDDLAAPGPHALPTPAPVAPQPPSAVHSAAIAMSLDQFSGAVPAPAQAAPQPPRMPSPAGPSGAAAPCASIRMRRLTDETAQPRPSLGRLTDLSLASTFPIDSLRELLRAASSPGGGNARDSIESVATEIRDLIRMSELQLMHVENNSMNTGEMNGGDNKAALAHEDREVVEFNARGDEERVSELRITAVTRDGRLGPSPGAGLSPRLADSTEFTNYSKISLMDASMMTIPADDMSALDERHAAAAAAPHGNVRDLASAELLLRLSNNASRGEAR